MSDQNVFFEALSKELTINAVHVNVAQEYIMITEDKTYRCLNEWRKTVGQRDAWIAPISLLAPLVLAFVTADFKDAFGIPKDTWRAIFMIGILLSGIWTAISLLKVFRSSSGKSVEELIDQLKKGAVIQRTSVETVKAESMPSQRRPI
jgi:hypothetical protein